MHAKTNTEEDDIMIMKLEKEQITRMRAKEAVMAAEVRVQMEEVGEDQDDTLFIPADTPARGPSTSSKTKGRKRKLADNAATEGEDDDHEE